MLLYCTAPDVPTATALGRTLVDEGLVACINVLPGLVSVYRWQGAVEEAQEALLIVKVGDPEEAGRVRERLVALHPYQVPCVLEIPVSGGHPPYLAWLQSRGWS